jgi:hypothetical protein
MFNAKITIDPKSVKVVRKVKKEFAEKLKRQTHRKEYHIGKSRAVVHSDLLLLTKGQRREWYRSEMDKGNPVLKEIARAVNACYKEHNE